MIQPGRPPSFARDVATILVLALAPAAGVGIARFAYSLLLPDMRLSLGWSYSAAGFMNTINAVGYLAGAMIAAAAMRRAGQFGALFWGTAACVAALAVSAATADFVVLSAARLVAGIGAAIAFVAGGVAATRLAERHPARASFLVSLYYIGPGLGIVVSGIGTPLLLERLGPGSWWIAWGALAVLTAVLTLLLPFARTDGDGDDAAPQTRARIAPMALVLLGYTLFSIGSIACMTFMIDWLRAGGASGHAQSAFWSLLGFGGICAPFMWSWAITALRGGRAVAAMTAVSCFAFAAALWLDSLVVQLAAAFVFGSAFFAVVSATTAFVRRNFPASAWPGAVGAMTFAFALGQAIGPVMTGAISDETGNLSAGLAVSAAVLAIAVVIAAMQRDLAAPTAPR